GTGVIEAGALPRHDEIAGRVHRHRGVGLVLEGDRVDGEFAALRDAGGVVALRENVPAPAPAAPVALPAACEVARRVHRDGGRLLRFGGGRVDAELAADLRG